VQYVSQNPGLQVIVRDEIADYSVPGQKRVIKPVLVVEFGQFGSAWNPGERTSDGGVIAQRHEFGNAIEFADVRGGFIDLEQMIAQKKMEKLWDDEDAEAVRNTLEYICDHPESPYGNRVQRHVPQAPTAPWPTYDDMHESAIAEQAQLLGLLPAAIVYERATHNRETLVAQMEELAQAQEALSAA
jgi:hypothetical protein